VCVCVRIGNVGIEGCEGARHTTAGDAIATLAVTSAKIAENLMFGRFDERFGRGCGCGRGVYVYVYVYRKCSVIDLVLYSSLVLVIELVDDRRRKEGRKEPSTSSQYI